MSDAIQMQREYYARTAAQYDEMHVQEGDEHFAALAYFSALAPAFGISTVLDVGCGTGRAVKYLVDHGFDAHGVEPVKALLDQAITQRALPPSRLTLGAGQNLPFPENSFDAVCEFAVLHHVADPQAVVQEMLRVARKVVVLSDCNRFGQGSVTARLVKLLLYRAHLWGATNRVKTWGRGYAVTEGDGVSYSYSVYDSLHLLDAWSDQVLLMPTAPERDVNWFRPLLTSSQILVMAVSRG